MSCFSLDWRAVSRRDWGARQCGLKFMASPGGWPGFVYTGGKQGQGNGLNCLQLFNYGKGFENELRSLHSLHLFGLFCLQNYSIVKSKERVGSLRDRPAMSQGKHWALCVFLHWALILQDTQKWKRNLTLWFRDFWFFFLIPEQNNNFLLLLFLTQEK